MRRFRMSRIDPKLPLLPRWRLGGGVLPDFYLIPAVRDLTEEVKFKTTTNFGRLMARAVREMAERDPLFSEARERLQTVMQSLNTRDGDEENELAALERNIETELDSWGVKVNIEVTPPELEKLFEMGTEISLHDDTPTPAGLKGHGLQRAVIFALLRSWAATLRAQRQSGESEGTAPRKQSDSVVFAMEEPELFLHPHAQRRLSNSLREIAATAEHQVFICTHSTHFVDLAHYKEIAIVRKEDAKAGSYIRQHTAELFSGDDKDDRKRRFRMAHWINPDRGEMFFSIRVVFVEGETERVVLPFVGQKLQLFDSEVSIVDCGSKHNLPLYIEIAKAFQIPYLVLHDEDLLPGQEILDAMDEDKRKGKQHTFGLNAIIGAAATAPLGSAAMFKPDFEEACGVSKSQGGAIGKALAALEHFENVAPDDIPQQLRLNVSAAYS